MIALQHRRSCSPMWAFPKGKPQLFSTSPWALGGGMRCYSFGRRIPRWQQSVLAAQPLVPGVRRVFVTRVDTFEPVCGWEQWQAWEQWLHRREARVASWVHLRSQWGKPRSSVLGLGRGAEPQVFVRIEQLDAAVLHPRSTAVTFRVPLLRDSTVSGSWLLRSFDAVPGLHRTPRWQPERLRGVAKEASRILETELVRPEGIPSHWRPMHGDFVPWNLREDRDSRLWLLDWEDAGWGPPFADLVRYAAAYQSIFDSHSRHIATMIRQAFPTVPAEAMAEAASFWTSHPNLGRPALTAEPSTSQTADVRRSQREYEALRLIARRSA